MWKKTAAILCVVCVFAVNSYALGQNITVPSSRTPAGIIFTDIVSISVEQQYDAVRPGSESALAIHFTLVEGWHFYASAETAPGGVNLKLKPSVDAQDVISFSKAIFPRPQFYFDKSSGEKLEVFSNKFTVFLPFSVGHPLIAGAYTSIVVKIGIEGAVCSGFQCRMPDFGYLSTAVKIAPEAAMSEPKFALPDVREAPQVSEPELTGQWASYSVWFALGLAFLAGLSLNIMPCVWPVLPLIVMRIVEQAPLEIPEPAEPLPETSKRKKGKFLTGQAKQSKSRSIAMGSAFCFGILLFFACLAVANVVLQVVYGTVLQWGDQFRNPGFVAGMALLLVVLALFMFGVFTISVPSSIAGKSGSGKGFAGAVGMGFLAAILSTPCSFAILAAAFAWAQTQPLLLATVAIMVIGVGMAVPYAILTSTPGLLKRLPKAGRWMELFKQTIGFVLLIIAVKLIAALPEGRRMGVLYFAVVLGFCVWMWGGWVSPASAGVSRKWLVRIIAVVLAVSAGWLFLPASAGERISWQRYDSDLIESALTKKRPVLIKFTADWCLSCQAVDRIVYSHEDIAKLIEEKGVLAIKADTTVKDYPATLALKNVYSEPGVPVSILFAPGRSKPVRWRNIFFADELKSILEEFPPR